MRKFCFILTATLSCLLGSVVLNAQDIIRLSTGEEIKAKVLEVRPYDVTYRLYDNPDGPLYTVMRSDILTITYPNGSRDIFNASPYMSYYPYAESPDALRPGMRYNELKRIYSTSQWDGYWPEDRYNTANWCLNFIFPGLGQMVMGEAGRGLAFLGGATACLVFGTVYSFSYTMGNAFLRPEDANRFAGISSACYLALCGISIWSMADAAKMAKIKNMYDRDMRNYASNVEIKLAPWVAPAQFGIGDGIRPATGLTLALKF